MVAGARPSPNIWNNPAVYELENRAADPDGRLAGALSSLATWTDRAVLDIGCGTGFHLPFFAAGAFGRARSVVGVEPHLDLVAIARRRTRGLGNVRVLEGTAQALPVPDASVDVVHARWAYFFGPGCEPGLAELDRVVRRGGTALLIDNDGTRSTFGSWFRRGYPMVDPDEVERFWSRHGWTRTPVDMGWRFESRSDFEAVVRIEFAPAVADRILSEYDGLEVDYAVNVWSKRFGL